MKNKVIEILSKFRGNKGYTMARAENEILTLFAKSFKKESSIEDISEVLTQWEQFKKTNWWESESIDVEKLLMDRFSQIYNKH